MVQVWHWLRHNYKLAILAVTLLLAFIAFEARQQLFYAENFNNGIPVEVGFWYFLQSGLYRWLIWLALSIPVIIFLIRKKNKEINIENVAVYGGLVTFALLANLLLITLVQVWSLATLVTAFMETFEFYFFHKAPIIFAALVFLVLLVEYCLKQEALQLHVEEVGSLKYTNEQLYQQIKAEAVKDEAVVIQVKVGNRIKLVPLETIVWIEADDYCVRIHVQGGKVYTLRSTMKALEEKLPADQFARVHRKAIVNLTEVSEFVFGGKPSVILQNRVEVPMAQSRVKMFRDMGSYSG